MADNLLIAMLQNNTLAHTAESVRIWRQIIYLIQSVFNSSNEEMVSYFELQIRSMSGALKSAQ